MWTVKPGAVEMKTASGPKDFKVGSFTKKEFEEWADLLDIERNVWSMLKKAASNIMEGRSDYHGAYEKTKKLLIELDLAFTASVRIASGAFAFFEDGEKLSKEFDQNGDQILAFSVWCAEHLTEYCVG